jgi:hypothetical protein
VIDVVEPPLLISAPFTSPKQFLGLLTKTEKKSITKSNDEDVSNVWLNVTASTLIEPYGNEFQAGLALLVSKGVLAQVRSDEILTATKALADAGYCDNKYSTP